MFFYDYILCPLAFVLDVLAVIGHIWLIGWGLWSLSKWSYHRTLVYLGKESEW